MILLLAALSACAPAPAPPRVDEVLPEWGWRGETTEVNLLGSAFFPDVQVSTYDADAGRVDASFQVWLETPERTRLSEVELLDYGTLRAEVPEGLEVGVYGVTVETPSGLSATLADAFSVTATRADHLGIALSDAAFEVNQEATLALRLEDPDHETVPQPLEVELRATSAAGAAGVSFRADGLGAQTPTPDGVGIRGTLASDGTATVLVASSVPDDVTFTVSPVDDEVIDPDAVLVSWEPGVLTDIEIVLPEEDFRATAGEPFLVDLVLYDRDGNELGPQAAEVYLYESCGTFNQAIDLSLPGPWEVELTTACEANELRTFGLSLEDGASPPFPVLAGPQAGLAVTAYPSPVVAGSGLLLVQVDAVDPWGNIVTGVAGTATLTDSAGGLDPRRGVGTQSCGSFDDGRLLCTASPIVAGEEVVLTAEDDAGFSGASNPLEVIPDLPEEVVVFVDSPTLVAGEEFAIVVGVRDQWGNGVPFDAGGGDPVSFQDDTGTLACRYEGPFATDATYTCSITRTTAGDVIGVSVLGLDGVAPGSFPVLNGALGLVEIDLFAASVSAGASFTVRLAGFDDYGNAYTFPTSGSSFDLSDTTGSISPGTAYLDSDGEVSLAASITVAAEGVRLYATQSGTTVGESAEITVLPGPMTGFEVETDPWVDVASGGTVSIGAVDAYGNVLPSYTGDVTVTSTGGLCTDTVADPFVSGRSATEVACEGVGFQETLRVEDEDGLSGESAPFDVLDFACVDGPTAALALDGGSEVTACLVSGAATVDADASGSTAGGASLSFWHLVDGDGTTHRDGDPTQSFAYTDAGTRRIVAVAVDARGCASEASGLAYIGEDDGTPTGPLVVTTSVSAVATGGTISATITATDCAGDIPLAGELFVRADLGEVDGTSTGGGISVTLDGSGSTAVDWSFPDAFAGTAALSAHSASGSAQGVGEVTVTGDAERPQVLTVDPSGYASGEVSSIEVVFSEEMRTVSVVADAVDLTGPSGAVDVAVTLDADYRTATLTPTSTVDASAGTWTLRLDDQMRDLAGNRLSGDWSGSAADFSVEFGDVAVDIPEVSGCAVDVGRFFPDGDPGVGREADEVTLTPSSSASPAWWWLEVDDAAETTVRSLRADGAATSIAWDGRGNDGRVVGVGVYLARLHAVDDHGNARAVCESVVAVDQHWEIR